MSELLMEWSRAMGRRTVVAFVLGAACLGASTACGGARPTTEPLAASEPLRVAVSLRLSDAGEIEGVPSTRLDLVTIDEALGRSVYPAGVHEGACAYVDSLAELEGAFTRVSDDARLVQAVRCWWGAKSAVIALEASGAHLRVVEAPAHEIVKAHVSEQRRIEVIR